MTALISAAAWAFLTALVILGTWAFARQQPTGSHHRKPRAQGTPSPVPVREPRPRVTPPAGAGLTTALIPVKATPDAPPWDSETRAQAMPDTGQLPAGLWPAWDDGTWRWSARELAHTAAPTITMPATGAERHWGTVDGVAVTGGPFSYRETLGTLGLAEASR